jgi:hypothetical protein
MQLLFTGTTARVTWQWNAVLRLLYPVIIRAVSQFSSSAKVKAEWRCISARHICIHGEGRETFTSIVPFFYIRISFPEVRSVFCQVSARHKAILRKDTTWLFKDVSGVPFSGNFISS